MSELNEKNKLLRIFYDAGAGNIDNDGCHIDDPDKDFERVLKQEGNIITDMHSALEKVVSDLLYQIESKHGPEAASKYPSIVEARAALSKAEGR